MKGFLQVWTKSDIILGLTDLDYRRSSIHTHYVEVGQNKYSPNTFTEQCKNVL